jgi:hypothetical protein
MKWFRNPWNGAFGLRSRKVKLYLWAGAWSIFDRSGGHRFSTKQCVCHRFSLFVGPFGIERRA